MTQSADDDPGLSIVRVEPIFVPPYFLFVRVEAENGLVGWGEAGAQTHAPAVAACIQYLSASLLGTNAASTNALWDQMHASRFFRGGAIAMAAISALDIAFWDLKARSVGQPIHRILGGPVRDRQRAYVWLGADAGDDSPLDLADQARAAVSAGFDCVKLTIPSMLPSSLRSLALIEAQVAAVRDAIGYSVDIAIDCHGRCNPSQSLALTRVLEPFRLLFIEEPVLPEYAQLLNTLAGNTGTPIAAGERAFDRWESYEILRSGVLFVQPDVAHCGGITELSRIATIASVFGAVVAPHCAIGPIALSASLQVGFAISNVSVQELPLYPGIEALFFKIACDSPSLRPVDGHFGRLSQPGLGITIDEDFVRSVAENVAAWRPPSWHHNDGSLAEW